MAAGCLLILLLFWCGLAAFNVNEKLHWQFQCVNLEDCPVFVQLVKGKQVSKDIINLLEEFNCGYHTYGPKVWCKNPLIKCTTPDSQPGVCRNITNCLSYTRMISNMDLSNNTVRKYLRKFRCKNDEFVELTICCPEEFFDVTESPDLDENPTTPPIEINNSTVAQVNITNYSQMYTIEDLLPKAELDQCGHQISDSRIFGGEVTDIEEFPWLAILQYNGSKGLSSRCGGSLINNRYILTAAHCVDSDPQELDSVILGEYDTRNETDCIYEGMDVDCAPPIKVVKVEKIIVHPNWASSERKFYDDIALIRLREVVKYSAFVQPICLPDNNINANSTVKFTVAGWGRTETEERSSLKRKVNIKLNDSKVCTNVYKRELNMKQLCLGNTKKGDSCNGDSGSPAMAQFKIDSNIFWYALGVVSLGYNNPCGVHPAVYTYVPRYMEWIKENVKP